MNEIERHAIQMGFWHDVGIHIKRAEYYWECGAADVAALRSLDIALDNLIALRKDIADTLPTLATRE